MNEHDKDQKLTEEFDRLRRVEFEQAPSFSSLLPRSGKHRAVGDKREVHGSEKQRIPKPGLNSLWSRYGLLHPTAGLAVIALSLAIVVFVLLRPGHQDGNFDAVNQPLVAAAIQFNDIDELPTDFLLETPWPQLVSLEQETQVLDLPYEFLEELTDEP